MANLQERLIREEARMTSSEDTAGAYSALRSDNKSERSESSGTKPKKESSGKSRDPEDVEYFKYKQKGHYARECKSKRKSKPKRDNSESRESRDCAFMADTAERGKRGKSVSRIASVKDMLAADLREIWLTDSGTSRHITNKREWFVDYREVTNGKNCAVMGQGTIPIEKFIDGSWESARIEKVLYVPAVTKNLFLVGVATKGGRHVVFGEKFVKIMRQNKVLATGVKVQNEIYRMLFRVVPRESAIEENVSTASLRVWHESGVK